MNNFVSALEEKMEKYLLPFATKLNDEPHLAALKSGMTVTIPLMIIGGFAMLLAVPPIPPGSTNSFLLAWGNWAAANSNVLMAPYHLTIGIISIYVVFAVAFSLAKEYKLDGMTNAILALFLFWLTSASPITLESGQLVVPMGGLGAVSMFYSIIVAFVTVDIMKFMMSKNIKIKLPDSVPSNVTAPFEALIPAVFLTILFILLNIVCMNMTGGNLSTLVFTMLRPLISASSSLPATIMLSMLLSLFWFFGIHGNNMIAGVLGPITTANLVMNAEYYINGTGTFAPLSGGFLTIFGNWMSYPAMVLCFFLVAKSTTLKSIRKVTVIPDIFNINEPLTFGVPVVMNVTIALPIMLINIINCTVAYLVMSSGAVNSISVSLPFTVPGVLQLFLGTGGDFRAVVLWLVLFVISVLLMFPFVKMYDKQLLVEEESNN